MMYSVNIKTFLRADKDMLDVLLPHVSLGFHYKDHWMLWMIPTYKVTTDVGEWLKVQPSTSWETCKVIGVNAGVVTATPSDRYTYLTIGVSLSMLDQEQIRRIHDTGDQFSLVEADVTFGNYLPTKNPSLFTLPGKDFLYIPRCHKAAMPVEMQVDESAIRHAEIEQKFIDSLVGHDFFYEYSDSLSVYRAGKAHEEKLKLEGCAMGLSKSDVDRLYAQAYKAHLK